jgi:RNA polymerase sigma-70 factor (ECF subfamily)
VQAECDADGKAGRFATLKGFLTGARGELPLAEAARVLGLSLAAVKSVVHRLRERYRELVRAEIAETLAEGEDVEEELRWLFSILGAR